MVGVIMFGSAIFFAENVFCVRTTTTKLKSSWEWKHLVQTVKYIDVCVFNFKIWKKKQYSSLPDSFDFIDFWNTPPQNYINSFSIFFIFYQSISSRKSEYFFDRSNIDHMKKTYLRFCDFLIWSGIPQEKWK